MFFNWMSSGISNPVKIPMIMIRKCASAENSSSGTPTELRTRRAITEKPPVTVNKSSILSRVVTGCFTNLPSASKDPIPIESMYSPMVTLYRSTVLPRNAESDWPSRSS